MMWLVKFVRRTVDRARAAVRAMWGRPEIRAASVQVVRVGLSKLVAPVLASPLTVLIVALADMLLLTKLADTGASG